MIKLNNKNITYVALADSNNSVKGVKEIWYADSANSVKLVYRRKDALIEGEDYEKYHWLRVETGMQNGYYMSLPMSTNFSFTRKYLSDWSNTWYYWTPNYVYYTDSHKLIQIYDSINSITIDSGDTSTISIGDTINIISTPDLLLFNGKTVNRYNYASRAQFCIYNTNRQIITSLNSAITVNDSMRYIPCKLLKPVPKWLDANGIRRQVGECGMIDLVSGKFYGNVSSVGTFTVENYYERKEWLVGDGSAYINTNIKSIIGDFIEVKFDCSMCPAEDRVFGREQNNTSDTELESRFLFRCLSNNYSTFWGKEIYTIKLSDTINSMLIDLTQNIMRFETGESIAITCGRDGDYSLFLFADNNRGNVRYASLAKISQFEIDRQISLIPCTLTMDLPASMDANNIARTKGTSGMWDLVSDRFYGNVANSGTFKAVNLAENVDYEVHQWLRAEVDTRASMAALPVNSTNLYFKCKRIRGLNFHYFTTNDHEYYCESPDRNFPFSIWKYSESTIVYRNTDIVSDEVIIDCSSDKIYVNGYEIPIYGYPISYVQFRAMSTSGMETLTSSVTVDGVERYIPVKLLKSIPAKYDANGIARQAGECGMYDTVNDVFYGNVASSGTFTVEDDN